MYEAKFWWLELWLSDLNSKDREDKQMNNGNIFSETDNNRTYFSEIERKFFALKEYLLI